MGWFVQKGDLWSLLLSDNDGHYKWYQRGQKLALDIATGIAFLHSLKIVHRCAERNPALAW